MLRTLVFILLAYGIYALISAMSGRKGLGHRTRRPMRARYGWLGLLAAAGVVLGLVAVMAQSFDEQGRNLKLAGFLGTVWAEGWPGKVEGRTEYPPIKNGDSKDQPVYALLHPGTSPAELAQETTAAKPKPALKPKLRQAPGSQAKGSKAVGQAAKKDKTLAKSKVKTASTKKKKPASPPAAAAKKNPEG